MENIINSQIIYIIIGAAGVVVIMLLFNFFILGIKNKNFPDAKPRKIKYNFYLLRMQYKELIDIANSFIVRAKEQNYLPQKMKYLNMAQKRIKKGLSFFPDNYEGENLLLKIAGLKRSYIESYCRQIDKSLEDKYKNLSLKKYLPWIMRYLIDIKKLNKQFPHSLWTDFYKKLYKSYVQTQVQIFVYNGNKFILRHQYKQGIKQYRSTLKYLSSLKSNKDNELVKLEKRIKDVIEKANKRYENFDVKKAA